MSLDIDPNSVIHKHIVRKITNRTFYCGGYRDQNCIISKEHPEDEKDYYHSKHSLTMLPSFHISLDPPCTELDNVGDSITVRIDYFDLRAFIGEIILADIHISEKDGKKSAWIPLHPELVDEFMPHHHNHRHYASPNDPNGFNHAFLHISLANLTGNPHDSIARPEDCIIDTITA